MSSYHIRIHFIFDITPFFFKAISEFQNCEKERLERTNLYLKRYCELEKKNIEVKKKLIENFETAVQEVNTNNDLALFIQTKKLPELTHKYSKVLEYLDWNHTQK